MLLMLSAVGKLIGVLIFTISTAYARALVVCPRSRSAELSSSPSRTREDGNVYKGLEITLIGPRIVHPQ